MAKRRGLQLPDLAETLRVAPLALVHKAASRQSAESKEPAARRRDGLLASAQAAKSPPLEAFAVRKAEPQFEE